MQARSVKKILSMEFPTYKLTGIWERVLGAPERNGAWLIWGEEKNGKTTIALMLANYLANIEKVLYVSGEEGIGNNFKQAMRRAGIDHTSKLNVIPYMALPELDMQLQKARAAKIVVMDNITVYHEELKYGAFGKLLATHNDKIFIFLAHEEKGQPFTSSAKLCSRYAKIKVHVEGMAAFVSGRCPGGHLMIDEDKAALYWGEAIKDNVTI